jgi:hypothetical protein
MYKLWSNKEERETQWSKIDAVKNAGLALDAKLNPLKSGKQPTWSEEAKKYVIFMCCSYVLRYVILLY